MYARLIIFLALGLSYLSAWGQAPCSCDPDSCECGYQLAEVLITQKALSSDELLTRFYQTSSVPNIEEVLRRLPGLSLVKRGAYAQEPVLRGLGTNRVNLTIDGMRMFEACTDKMDPVSAYVEPNNLQSIDVQAGPKGSSMGSSSGGGINFRLKQAQYASEGNWRGYFSGRSQTVSQGGALRGGAEYRSPRLGIATNAVYRKQGNYRLPNGERLAFTQYEKLNYSLALRYQSSERGEWQVNLLGDHARDIGYVALPMDVATADALIGALTYRHRPENLRWLSWEAKLYHNRIDHVMDDSQRDSVAMHMDMPGYTRTTGGYWKSSWMPNLNHLMELKVDAFSNLSYAEMTMYPEGESPMFMLTWPELRRSALGVYLRERWQFRPMWQLEAGARLEGNHSSVLSELGQRQLQIFFPDYAGQNLQPAGNATLGLNGRLNDYWQLRSLLAWGQRAPTVSEQFGYYLFSRLDGFDYLGNPFLKPEQAWQGELGATYQREKLELKLTAFGYQFYDYIQAEVVPDYSAMTIGAAGVKQYENLPEARLLGGEMQLAWQMTQALSLVGTAQYSHGRDHRAAPLPLIPPLQVQGALRYATERSSLQLETSWNAGQSRFSEPFGEDGTPAYTVANLRGSHQFQLKEQRIEVSAGVENLLNATYWNHLDWGNFPQPGRSGYLSVVVFWERQP